MSVVELAEDLSPVLTTGKKTIGGTAVQLFPNGLKTVKGVQFKASSGNGDTIYIGGHPSVTAGTDDDWDGMFIDASEGLFVPCKDASKLYAIAGAAAQVLYWMAV